MLARKLPQPIQPSDFCCTKNLNLEQGNQGALENTRASKTGADDGEALIYWPMCVPDSVEVVTYGGEPALGHEVDGPEQRRPVLALSSAIICLHMTDSDSGL
jgi:hypothetical protein